MSREDITAADGWFIGEDQSFAFTILDAGGAPLNITSFTIVFEVSDLFSGDAVFSEDCTVTDGPAGVVEWVVPSEDTIAIPGDHDYSYVLRRTNTNARTELAWGTARILDVYVNYD